MQGLRYRLAQKETNDAAQVTAHTNNSVWPEKMSHDDEQQQTSETNAESEVWERQHKMHNGKKRKNERKKEKAQECC